MKRTQTCTCCGFTLIELMVVIVIIVALVGILMPTIYGTKKQAKVRQARAEITGLTAAIMNYKFRNKEWPSGAHDVDVIFCPSGQPAVYEGPSALYERRTYGSLLNTLTGGTPPYLDPRRFSIQARDRALLDPWDTPYFIALDSDYDGRLPVPCKWPNERGPNNTSLDDLATNVQGVAIWSCGPDRVSSWPPPHGDPPGPGYREDDIITW